MAMMGASIARSQATQQSIGEAVYASDAALLGDDERVSL